MTILSQLLERALKIKNQASPAGNTGTLVGGLFELLVDLLSTQDKKIRTLTSGLIWQSTVNTIEDLSKAYPTPQTGWAALVKNKGTVHAWNGKEWIDTGLQKFPTDVALNGGSEKTLQQLDQEKAGRDEVGNLVQFGYLDNVTHNPVMTWGGAAILETNVETQLFGKNEKATKITPLRASNQIFCINPDDVGGERLSYQTGDNITLSFQMYSPIDVVGCVVRSLTKYDTQMWYDRVLYKIFDIKSGVHTYTFTCKMDMVYNAYTQIVFHIPNQIGTDFYLKDQVAYVGTPVIAPMTNNVSDLTDAELSNVTDGDILVRQGTGWVNKNISSLPVDLYYGVEIDTTIADPALMRIGNSLLHKTLPVHSGMRRCLLKDDGTVNYYLHPNDSTKKTDGRVAKLDGSDGQVMVEIPGHYRKFEHSGTKLRGMISEFPLPGFHKVAKIYVSAYEACLQHSTNKLSSVVNTTPDYRGGYNNGTWDNLDKTLLGKAVNATLLNCRIFARNRNNGDIRWNIYTYDAVKAMQWLYLIEYAHRNCQLDFNPVPTAEGYKQGGLGEGVVNLPQHFMTQWNEGMPPAPVGLTNVLGNNSGNVEYRMPDSYQAIAGRPSTPITVKVPSYRGIENPFGSLMKWLDGVNIETQTKDAGGESRVYLCSDPKLFQSDNCDGYTYVGNHMRIISHIKNVFGGSNGHLFHTEGGASSATFWCDDSYVNEPASGVQLRPFIYGGMYTHGVGAGLFNFQNSVTAWGTYAYIGTRLCFIPETT